MRQFPIQVKIAKCNKCQWWQNDSLVKIIWPCGLRDLETSTEQRNFLIPWADLGLLISHLYRGISCFPLMFCEPKYICLAPKNVRTKYLHSYSAKGKF